jgi:prolyl-tRNA synthetase
MGCYGIGINRILASAVEAGHDANGIIWPLNLAPYEVLLVPLQLPNEAVEAKTDEIAAALEAAGVDVLIDDRDHRPGFKFKDADLIGIPVRIVIGERGLKEGNVEVKWRTDPTAHMVPAADAASAILGELAAKKDEQKAVAAERRAARLAAKGTTA